MPWKNPWYDASLSHHHPAGFRNTSGSEHQPGDLRRWRNERKSQGVPLPPREGYQIFIHKWYQPVDLTCEGDGLWWLGHASLLLRTGQRYLLIDPVFSDRASPLVFAGPKRKTPVPLHIQDLPQLDAILISHNHYDHLDSKTMRQLRHRFPDVQVCVPLGLKRWFTRRGFRHVIELDWWQNSQLHDITFHCVPSQHWSMRTFWDRNRSLWCGWVVEFDGIRFWFSGDTGYTPDLLKIADRLGTIDVAALPIGAYAPRWFMGNHHMDPQQAVALWQQLGRPKAVPIHWGVFELADESLDMPPQELSDELQAREEQGNKFIPLRIGQFLPFR